MLLLNNALFRPVLHWLPLNSELKCFSRVFPLGSEVFSWVREAPRIFIIKKPVLQAICRLKVDEKLMCVMFKIEM